MKYRFLSLLSVCLLFGATLAGAAPADTPGVTPSASAPEQTEPSCEASLVQPDFLTPSPSPKAGTPCGPCSLSNCQGLTVNASCYYMSGLTYAIGKCYADSVCSGGGFSPSCRCRTGPEL